MKRAQRGTTTSKKKKDKNKMAVNKLALTYISQVAMRLPVPSPWKALTSEGFSKTQIVKELRFKEHFWQHGKCAAKQNNEL
jgi:hypothetical protein